MTRLQTGAPINIDGLTLIIIERLSINVNNACHSLRLNAGKEPYALVIRDTRGLRALDMMGKRLVIEELIEEIPDLIDLIGREKEA